MKDHSILFNGPMVRALLAGQKTQTRRAVKGLALEWLTMKNSFTAEYVALPDNHLCPYGQPGDLLWVKETFYAWGRWEKRYSEEKARDEWHFADLTESANRPYRYAATDAVEVVPHCEGVIRWWKRPAIFMPRTASRTDLEIVSIRVERLQDISEADAKAEGCNGGQGSIPDYSYSATPGEHFMHVWASAYGNGSWIANPWVWVVEFRRARP